MKAINGEKIFISYASKTDAYSQHPALFFVTEGAIYFGDRQVNAGQCFFLSAYNRINIAEDGVFPAVIYKFELEFSNDDKLLRARGLDLPLRVFNTVAPEKLDNLLGALCNDTYTSISDELDSALAGILLALISPPQAADALPDYGNVHVNKVAEYIEENFASKIRVEALAQTMGLDRMYLRNLFVKHTGMSTMEYIMTTRMNHAKRMLNDDSLSVSEVANAVGYTDVLCFSKAFKSFTGVSPSEYRSDNRKRDQRKQSKSNQVPVFIL